MRIQIPISLFAGAFLGAISTYFVMRDNEVTSAANLIQKAETPEEIDKPHELDPFASGYFIDESSGLPYGGRKMNMSDPTQRDFCISLWYSDMSSLVDNLELHTGHRFQKQVGKVYAGPVEILEEQADFMRSFLAETERISSSRDATEGQDSK